MNAARAKRDKVIIYRSDDRTSATRIVGQGTGSKGQTPALTQTGQKFSAGMIAAANNRGLMRFKLFEGALNVTTFIDFIKRLVTTKSF